MFNITKKRATDSAKIKLKNGDGTLMKEDGVQLTVTIYGPGSQVWADAQAELNRRRAERVKQADGNIAAVLDGGTAEQNEFLADITISFDGWEYPMEGKHPKRDMFLACYEDKQLGYLRDQIFSAGNSWEAFTKGSAKG